MFTSPDPLPETRFLAAFAAALAKLDGFPIVSGIGIVRPVELTRALVGAVGPYYAGERIKAVEAIADALTANWRQFSRPESRQLAVDEAAVLLAWVEAFDPARSPATA